MNETEIRIRLAQGEDSRTQFKSAPIGVAKLAAEMAAFTNSGGGVIFFGVNDDGSIVGLSREQVATLDSEISNASNDNIRPPVYVQTEYHTLGGKLILLVVVADGIAKPYTDKSGNIWVKSGPDKRRVTAREELQRMLQRSSLLNADTLPVHGTSFADLDRLHVSEFLERNYKVKGELAFAGEGEEARRILRNLGLMCEDELTLSGLLLFALNPQRCRPMDVAKCVWFNGNDLGGTDYLDSQDFGGTVRDIFKGIMSFLSRTLRHEQAGQGFNSIGIPEVPMPALEEYVVNMLLHRDYFVSSAWKVLVFCNRIELISPGSLPDNLTIEQMKSGVSVARNSRLLSFAVKDGLPYRGLGSGVSRALALYPKVDFISDPNGLFFKTIVWLGGTVKDAESVNGTVNGIVNGAVKDPEPANKRIVLQAVRENPGVRRPQLTRLTGLSERTLARILADLHGQVEFRGAPKTGGYYVIG